MEANLANAVLVADLLIAELDDDVVLVDGGVGDVGVVDGEDVLGGGHCFEGEDGLVGEEFAVVCAFEHAA
jgi:hypothetical protein